jgi:hypothetical protein
MEYKDLDFHLGKLGNDLIIITLPHGKLAFHEGRLIAFSGTKWTVRINQWGAETDWAMQELEKSPSHVVRSYSNTLVTQERIPQIHFFLALQAFMENPRVLLDIVARQAKESLDGL